MNVPLFPYRGWLAEVATQALATVQTLETTFHLTRMVLEDGVPGDLVECGVFAGANLAMMARASLVSEPPMRHVHIFDSFEGIPAGGQRDEDWPHPSGTSKCSTTHLAGNLVRWSLPADMFVWHRGVFGQTIPEAIAAQNPRRIAVLRLDADLYASTKDALPLIDLVMPGGLVIVDDFDLPGCRAALVERMNSGLLTGPIYWRKQ